MALFRKKAPDAPAFDPATQQVAVRRSICTGETTVGFIDRKTGHFSDICRIDRPQELEAFCRHLGVNPGEVKTIY